MCICINTVLHVNDYCLLTRIHLQVITEGALTSVEEYSEYLHNRARRGLERVLASEELWLTFRHTHFFNHEKSKTTDAALLRDLTRFASGAAQISWCGFIALSLNLMCGV